MENVNNYYEMKIMNVRVLLSGKFCLMIDIISLIKSIQSLISIICDANCGRMVKGFSSIIVHRITAGKQIKYHLCKHNKHIYQRGILINFMRKTNTM